MPPASMIFSRLDIRRDQMNNHGNIAKKKSHTLDQTVQGISITPLD